MALLYGPASHSFSKARCRYPISTSALTTVSPSSSAKMRMMPCMAGCAGPMLTCRCSLPPPTAVPSPKNSSRVARSAISGLDRRPDERLSPSDGVVLAQRVADELLIEEEAPQVRMTLEADAEHVPHLPLEPVGDGPEPAGGGHPRVVFLYAHLEADAVVVRGRVEMIDDLEARPVLAPGELEIVHRRDVDEEVEREPGVIAAEGEGVEDGLAGHHRRVIAAEVVGLQHAPAETRAQPRKNRLSVPRDSPSFSRSDARSAGPPPRSCPGASSSRR